jgi:hypothetical protein
MLKVFKTQLNFSRKKIITMQKLRMISSESNIKIVLKKLSNKS